ncbi:glucosyltransferase domain-containing protein [Bacillus salitolerans]|uniref:Glucosyltransferase domain-containing protein n=1 Tax=Bacillus salitolerans TaxID=1437434 RepID=A0ABW4LNU3_9BACI
MPEELLKKWNERIKPEWRLAFIAALLIGFFTHMYVFTNMLPNHDGLINIYNTQRKFGSGRFFLGSFSGISSYFDLPWVIGSLSILYLSIMSVLLTELFELKKKLSIILTAGLIITFPTVAATFSYMFTADGYMAGNLLAVLAILVTKKYKLGFLAGAVILFVSVGIYQANLTLILTVISIWFIRELLFQTVSIKSFFLYLLRYVSMTVIGMGLYTLTFKAYQIWFGGTITDYQGLNEVGTTAGTYSDQFSKIKEASLEFFFRGFVTTNPIKLFELLNVGLLILVVLILLVVAIQKKIYVKPVHFLLLIFCIVSLPILSFSLYFVSPGVEYHMLMVMALSSFYLLPIILYDRLEVPTFGARLNSWGVVVFVSLTIFNFALIDNIAYFNMTLKYEKSYALVNRILDRVEQTEGYEDVEKLFVYGRVTMKTKNASERIPENIPTMTGAMGEIILAQPYHYQYMLANYFGKSLKLANEREQEAILNSEEFLEMPVWPANGSIKIVDHIAIIKLSE